MNLAITVAFAILASLNVAATTPQIPNTLMFGGRKYAIHEIPMLGLWDYGEGSVGTGTEKPPTFQARNSANWVGYRAQFEIRESRLFLHRIGGRLDGKKRNDEELIPGKPFPIVASWYTGKIHLPVGDFDDSANEQTAVIIFSIERGVVTSVDFAERMKPVWTWNGLPQKEVPDKDAGPLDERGPE